MAVRFILNVYTGDFDAVEVSETPTPVAHSDLTGVGVNTHPAIDTKITGYDTHLIDATKHYLINDAGTSATDLLSAEKIIADLGGKQAASLTEYKIWLGDVSNDPAEFLLTTPLLRDAVNVITPTTGAITINAAYAYQSLALSGDPTFSVSGFVNGYIGNTIVKFTNLDVYTLAWPSGFVWGGGTEPTWEAGKTYFVNLGSDDGGTTGWMAVSDSYDWS